jgi:pimeloyl-ACP methyl ester carboxylesterase
MSWNALADEIAELMDSLGLKGSAIVGHSLGGKVAMAFSLRHGNRTQALVVEDMAPRPYPPTHGSLIEAMLAVDPSQQTSLKEVEDRLAESVGDIQIRRFLLKNVRRNDAGEMFWRLGLKQLAAAYPEITSALPATGSYSGPTLFLRGELSDYVGEADWPLVRALFPASQQLTIPGAGHWVHAEKPEAFASAVLGFLGCSASPPTT